MPDQADEVFTTQHQGKVNETRSQTTNFNYSTNGTLENGVWSTSGNSDHFEMAKSTYMAERTTTYTTTVDSSAGTYNESTTKEQKTKREVERSGLGEFEVDDGAWGKTREAHTFVADVKAEYDRTNNSELDLDYVDPNYYHDEVAITDSSVMHTTYHEELKSYYESQTQTSFTGGVAGPTTGSTIWGKDASGYKIADVSINNSTDDGSDLIEYQHDGHVTGSTEFKEEWEQDPGGPVTGGVLIDTSEYSWNYNGQTTTTNTLGVHVDPEADSYTSPPGLLNSLYELEGESGWDPSELTSLAGDLPYATLAGYAAGGWSAGPSGEEGTIAYTPPPGSEPEAPEEEEGESWGHFLAGFIPVYGSARDMYNSYQEGSYGWAAFNAAMLAVDLTGVGALAKMGAKAGVTLTATADKSLLNRGAKETIETGVKKGIQAAGSLGDNVAVGAKELGDDVAESLLQGRRAGTVVSDAALDQVERGLLADGVVVSRNADQMLASRNASGLTRVYKDGSAAIYLRSSPTRYELLHELQHIEHLKKIGASKYIRLAQTAAGNLQLEQFVYDMLRQFHWGSLTADEILHAQRYITLLGGNAW